MWQTVKFSFMTPLDEGKFPRHYCGVDQRLSHEAHNLGIVGSSPTPATNNNNNFYKIEGLNWTEIA